MFWVIAGIMLVAAVLVIAMPLYRADKKQTVVMISSVLLIGVLSGGLYSQIGTPNPDLTATAEGGMPSVEEMVTSLADRLKDNPDDVDGWKMLGRSYLQLRNFPGAIAAFERAVELESSQNGQTLADLGEAVLMDDPVSLMGRAGQLFENALALTPNNPKALFYSGMAAAQRGDNALAADRWEALLATSPPQNIRDILVQRIAEFRGEAPAEPAPAAATPAQPVVTAQVSLGSAAADAGLPDTTVFVIARDPNQPSPPIAAIRRRLSELPADISLSDADAMIPGRVPSGFSTLEIVARVSLSGEPIAQSGDWYGQGTIDTTAADNVQIVIDQQVK